jgi:hypothetical protein
MQRSAVTPRKARPGTATARILVMLVAASGVAATGAAARTTAERLAEVIAQHGWPCGGVERVEPLPDNMFRSVCADGHRYDVFVRPGWSDGRMRQTHLQPLLEVAAAMQDLDATEPTVRREAAEELARLGPEATAAASRLTRSVRSDSDPAVRAAAATALGRLGVQDDAIEQALHRATADPSPQVRERAGEALALLRAG